MTAPEALVRRLEGLLPADALPFLASSEARARVAFRVVTLRAPEADTVAALTADGLDVVPLPHRRGAFTVPAAQRDALTHHAAADDGRIYVMNPSSMLPAEVLDPAPGERVLDLAAAPGGKSIHLADRMDNTGELSCVEPVKSRFFRLRGNLERCGVSIARTFLADGRAVGKKVPGRFDRVLLDGPCSSESRVRLDDPATWEHWSERKVGETSHKLRRLLLAALDAVRPGGRVVYSTCAFSPEENELSVQHALRRWGDEVEVLPVELPGVRVLPGLDAWQGKPIDPRLRHAVRVVPDGVYDGFFLCALARR